MKNQTLSIEQMKHLKDLGVDVSKASVVLIFIGEDGEHVGWEVENNGMPGAEPLYEWWNEESEVWGSTHKEYFDAETGSYDHSFREDCGVFTLQDMLEMMPVEINRESIGNGFNICELLHIQRCKRAGDDGYFYGVRYGSSLLSEYSFTDDSLIEAAYKLLCWLAENGHLEGGKQ